MSREINLSKRRVSTRGTRKVFLIVCEGERTEPAYFEGFRLPKHVVEVVGAGANTGSVVKEAERLASASDFDQVWCVFDRDSFPKQAVNSAILRAENLGFKVAFSNEAFELWYLLHFQYLDTALTRHQYFTRLNLLLEKKYKKNCPEMYEILDRKQSTAIRNAKRLEEQVQHNSWADRTPYTGVYKLVEALKKASRRKF